MVNGLVFCGVEDQFESSTPLQRPPSNLGGQAPRDERARRRATRLDIGLINNMPDAALVATQRQFLKFLEAGSGEFDVRLHLFALGSTTRGPEARQLLQETYQSVGQLRETPLDALIITGRRTARRDIA